MRTWTWVLLVATSGAASASGTIFRVGGVTDGGEFGYSVSGAGDVDGDGRSDLVVGAPESSLFGGTGGYVKVVSGATATVIYSLYPTNPYVQFGHSVDGDLDVNADGVPDIVVAAPGDAPVWDPGSGRGSISVFSGATGTRLHAHYGLIANANLDGVQGVGDVNQDGYDDFAGVERGSPPTFQTQIVRVFSGEWVAKTALGLTPLTSARLHILSKSNFSGFGQSIAGIGDVDADGFPDFAIGAPSDGTGASAAGRAYVYSGLTGAVLRDIVWSVPDAQFGTAVCGADLDGDGQSELVVGAPHFLFGGPAATHVFDGATGSLVKTWPQYDPYDYFGFDTAIAGDADDDGAPDVLVGAWGLDRVYLFSGATGLRLKRFDGTPGDEFGWSVDGVGNVDGDACADMVIGARQFLAFGKGVASVVTAELCP